MPAASGHLLLFCLCSEIFPLLTWQRGTHTFLSPIYVKTKDRKSSVHLSSAKTTKSNISSKPVLFCHLTNNCSAFFPLPQSEYNSSFGGLGFFPLVVEHVNLHWKVDRQRSSRKHLRILFLTLLRIFWTDLPPPATRDRPPGCKTVFVGGLPENATEQLIMEVFGQCGDITAIRKSKKNFCHIRFADEFTVDKALFLSGTLLVVPLWFCHLHVSTLSSQCSKVVGNNYFFFTSPQGGVTCREENSSFFCKLENGTDQGVNRHLFPKMKITSWLMKLIVLYILVCRMIISQSVTPHCRLCRICQRTQSSSAYSLEVAC